MKIIQKGNLDFVNKPLKFSCKTASIFGLQDKNYAGCSCRSRVCYRIYC